MTSLKFRYTGIFASCFIIVCMLGCEFDSPYVPDTAGSSSLTGRITTIPSMDVTGVEVVLRGQDSFAAVTNADGRFRFRDIPPGDYSLQVKKDPYLQDSFPVNISKSTDEDMGDIDVSLKGAIVGAIPDDKVAIIHGEVEVTVYIDGVPIVPQREDAEDLTIDLASPESVISIHAATRITVYIDNVPFSATVQDEGKFIVEFVPPGIYSDIRVKLNSAEQSLPIILGPVVVNGGKTRFLGN